MSKKIETFSNRDNTISVKAYVGNGHGVHTNMFPVNYEELFDIPEDVLFRTNCCIVSSAYCRLVNNDSALIQDGITLDALLDRISQGILLKRRQGLCHTELATKDSVISYLKYIRSAGLKDIIKVFNFDKVLEFESKKTLDRVSSEDELDIYNRIMNLESIEDGYPILIELNGVENQDFSSAALLLLKCKVYDIEDKHYLKTKTHNATEKEALKIYGKTVFPQTRKHIRQVS